MMSSDTFINSYFTYVFALLVMNLLYFKHTCDSYTNLFSKIAQGQSEGYLALSGVKLKNMNMK